jgi:Rrf2 family transcriptional regulator, nitric oxide-sensitive transcriptional repressor
MTSVEEIMQLKRYTDYSLRTLIYLGLHPDRLVTIAEVAESFRISRNHLMKVVQSLTAFGYIQSVPGKRGGLSLRHAPESINLGDVVRRMEGSFNVVECFDPRKSSCCIMPSCTLKGILEEALSRFLESLDAYTLQDLLQNRASLFALATADGPKRLNRLS